MFQFKNDFVLSFVVIFSLTVKKKYLIKKISRDKYKKKNDQEKIVKEKEREKTEIKR